MKAQSPAGRRSRSLVGFFALSFLAAGCASAGSSGSGGSAFDPVTGEEIAAVAGLATDTLDLLQRLRPNWLTPFGGPVLLYVDGQRRGEAGGVEEFLRAQPVSSVASIAWERPEMAIRLPQAPLTGSVGGAILITTRGGEE
jgi:hypothetical protein